MFNRKDHRPMLAVLAFCLAALIAVHSAAAQNGDAGDDEALRALVIRYFELYAKKDQEAMAASWSASSPIINSRRSAWQRLFEVENYQFSRLAISRVRVEGERAFARVAAERTAIGAQNNVIRKTEIRVEYSFIKEGGQWKFFNEAPATMGLFNELAQAKTDVERGALLDGEPTLVTRELLFQLSANSDYAYTSANYDRAINLLAAARMVAERTGDKKEQANVWQNIGIIHFVKLRYQPALEAYQKALALNQELDRKSEIARMLTNIGLVHLALGKLPLALDYFQRGLALHEQLDERSEAARALDNIGNLFYEQGDYARATDYFRKSAERLESAREPRTLASQLMKIAKTEYEQGNDATAIDFYTRAVAKMDEAGEKQSRGYALHNIANNYYSEGDYAQALNYYLQSLEAHKATGNTSSQANALQGVALIHSLNGNHQLALIAYEKNLAIAQSLNDKAETALSQSKVGGALYALGRYPEAIDAFEKALALREQLGDPQDTAFALLDLGVTWFAQNEHDKALESYAKSRALYESANNAAGVATVLLNTALVHYARQDYAKTLELSEQAAALAKSVGESDLYWQARHRAGKSHFKLNNPDAARQALTEAIATIETMRPQANRGNQSGQSGQSGQPRFYESRIAPYLAMVDVAIAQGKGNEAFDFSERAKARTLLGIVQSAKVWINKTMSAPERERENRLLAELTRLNAQIAREAEKQQPNKFRLGELRLAAGRVRAEYETFRNKLYALRPTLKIMRGDGKPLAIEQAVLLANDAKTALLNFVETDEQVYLFAFTKKPATKKTPATPLRIYVLGANRAELSARISNLNRSIADRDPNAQAQSRELYDVLLKPAEAQLAGKEHWIISPDGSLWNLPFEALRTEADRFLIEDHAISRAPSLTAFQAISALRRATPAPRARRRTNAPAPALLAFGDPALSEPTTMRIKTMLSTEQIAPSPETRNEVAAIAAIHGAEQSVVFTGPDASEERLKADAGKHRILHLAARGIFNEAAPLFSAIALASAEGSKEDGMLDWREVIGLDLKADLVVLSSSESALPQAGVGRSLIGLAWALCIAGCPASLASQWRVDSPATAELMGEFHRALKASKQPARSWQTAVKQMLDREDRRHPYFWAGFQLLGDAR